jgi:ketosteroid isomerase-like protein
MTASADEDAFQMAPLYRQSPGADERAKANRQRLIDAFDAIVAGDMAPFWALFDPDVTFHEAHCLPYGGAHQGLEATQRAYAEMSATYSGMKTVCEDVLTSGDLCILYQTITFTVAANGRTGTLPVAEMFRFRGERIIEWRANYFDADLVARAIRGG